MYSCVYGICLCAYVCADVFTQVPCVEAEVWGSILPSPSLPYCLRQGLSWKLELTVLAKNSSSGNTWHLPACHPPKHWGPRLTLGVHMVLWITTRVLIRVQQAPYPLSHLPSPRRLVLNERSGRNSNFIALFTRGFNFPAAKLKCKK